jgi:hypothetical protein
MAAILNPKWPPKYKIPPIWAIFGFQVDIDIHGLGGILVAILDSKWLP